MSAIRHGTTIMRRATELRAAGWAVTEIPGVLEREFGVRPARGTVHRWISPSYAESERRRMRTINSKRWATQWTFALLKRATPACRAAFIRRLSSLDVPATSIAKVCSVLFDEPVSRHQVTYLLAKDSA